MGYSSSNAMRLHLNMACINRCGVGGIPNRFSCPAFETGMTWNFKVPLTPKYFFAKTNLCTMFETHCGHLFIFLTNPVILKASKVAKNQASFVHDRVRRGVGLFLIWRHNLLCMHFYKELMQCKSVLTSNQE